MGLFYKYICSVMCSNFSGLFVCSQGEIGRDFRQKGEGRDEGRGTEVQRVKRPRKDGAQEVVEKIPAFLTPKPTAVEEDLSPYVVQWGLLNKDTVVGDARAAAEWSKNVITPRDRAHVVESSEDLQN